MKTRNELGGAAAWLILLLVLITPLLIDPLSHDSFIAPKQLWVRAIVLILGAAALAELIRGGSFTIRLNGINLAALLFVLWNCLTVTWAQSPSLAGDQALWLLQLFAFALIFQNWIFADKTRLLAVGRALTLAGLFTALWTLYQDFGVAFYPEKLSQLPKLPDWRGFLAAGFGNTSHIADFLALSFIPSLLFFLFGRKKSWLALHLLHLWLSAAAMIVCWSVHSNLGLLIAAAFLLILLCCNADRSLFKRRWRRIALALAGWCAIVAFYVLPVPLNPHSSPAHPGIFQQAFSSNRWKEGGETRWVIWLNSFEQIKRFPVLGAGAGNFVYVYPQRYSPRLSEKKEWFEYAGAYTNAAHNELLETWIETGIIGLLLLIALVAAACYRLFGNVRKPQRSLRHINLTALALLIAFSVFALLNFPLRLPTTQLIFWMLIGAAAACPEPLFGRFPLRVTIVTEGPLRLQLRTTEMRKIEALSIYGQLPGAARGVLLLIIFAAVLFRLHINWNELAAQRLFKTGYLLHQRGNDRPAEKFLLAALERDPNLTDARSVLSELYVANHRPNEALAQLRILERRFQANELHQRFGQAYLLLGRREQAAEQLHIFYQRRPVYQTLNPGEYAWVLRELEKSSPPPMR